MTADEEGIMELTENADVPTWENEGGAVAPEEEADMFDDRPSLQDATWFVGNAAGEVGVVAPEPNDRYAADLGRVLDTYYSEVVEDFGDAEAASQHANWLNDTCPRCGGDHDRITPSDCPLWQPSPEETQS